MRDPELRRRAVRGGRLLLGASVMALSLGSGALAQAAADQAPPAAGEGAPAQEIVVTGSRIVRNGFAAPTPVTVVGGDRIEKLGQTNLGDVLNTLPQFRATSGPQTANISPTNAGMRLADLRGLGPTRTLVLVDGRRFVPSTLQGTVDLNLIPSLLVQRTEVVTGGASAQYGSDAVAGVVNVILDHRLEGFKAEAQYGQTQRGDNQDYLASFAGGTSFADGRGHFTGAFEYEKDEGTGGCYTRDWCALEYQDITNPLAPAAGHLAGFPAHNILPHAHTVTATPGGIITSGPLKGTAFDSNGTPYQFQYGQVFPNNSTFMAGGDGDNGFIGAPQMVVPLERYVAYGHADYDFSDKLRGFLEGSYGHTFTDARGAQTRDTGNIIIHGDNPYLPDGVKSALAAHGLPLTSATTFNFGRMGDDLGYTDNRVTGKVYRIALGLNGELSHGWSWNGYYQYGHDTYSQVIGNDRIQQQVAGVPNAPGQPTRIALATDAVVDPATGQIVCRSTLTNPNNGCQPVDLFGENKFSAAAKSYLYGTAHQSNTFEQHVAAINAQGDLFSTWAGPVSLATGLEWRRSAVSSTADPISATNGFYVFNSTPEKGTISVGEGYLETAVPLARDASWAKSLEFNGAVRETHYNLSGWVTSWKVGGVYEPTDWLRLRITRSRDIRAPNTDELFRPLTSGFATVNGLLTPVVSGGNANLKPELADTFTAGGVFTGFGALHGLRASLDYYNIDVKDAISTLTAQLIADRCSQNHTYCDLVTFTPSGVVASVQTIFLNLNELKTSGFDIEADYTLPLSRLSSSMPGQLEFRLLATYLQHLTTIDSTGLAIDRAGQDGLSVSGGGPGLPHWQANGFISYDNGPVEVTVQGRYIQGGLFDATLIGPGQAGYSVSLPNSINNNHVDGRFYVDLAAHYDLIRKGGRTLQVFGAIDNLFDTNPPVAPSNQGSTNMVLFDALGRAFRIGLRASY